MENYRKMKEKLTYYFYQVMELVQKYVFCKKIINCLNNFTIEFTIEEELVGGCSYDEFKLPITEKVISKAKASGRILLGAVGAPKYENLPFDLRQKEDY